MPSARAWCQLDAKTCVQKLSKGGETSLESHPQLLTPGRQDTPSGGLSPQAKWVKTITCRVPMGTTCKGLGQPLVLSKRNWGQGREGLVKTGPPSLPGSPSQQTELRKPAARRDMTQTEDTRGFSDPGAKC